MNKSTRIIGLLWLLIFAAQVWADTAREETMDSKDMQQWCVGRLLVSLPQQFRPVAASGNVWGVEITYLPGVKAEQAVGIRRQDLRAGRAELDGVPLRLLEEVTQGGQAILSYAQDFSELGNPGGDDWYEETYAPAGDGAFRLVQFVPAELREQRRHELLSVAGAISPWSGHMPDGAGACVGPAFVALPPGDEAVTMNFASDGEGGSYQIDYLYRLPGGRPLDLDALSMPGTQGIEVAGLSGVEESSPDRPGEFTMIAGRPGSARAAGIKIMAGFSNNGAQGMGFAEANEIWRAVLSSMKLRD